jgi:hypothetical protein
MARMRKQRTLSQLTNRPFTDLQMFANAILSRQSSGSIVQGSEAGGNPERSRHCDRFRTICDTESQTLPRHNDSEWGAIPRRTSMHVWTRARIGADYRLLSPRRLPLVGYLIALLLTGADSFPAEAHRQRTEGLAVDGISIPSLTHGQMAVIADNLSAIRSLADQESPGDLVMRRLRDYTNLQSFACLWGMVPGSIRDEASPFNECAHAYLAGAQALLMHLRQMPGVYHKPAEALVAKIELEMLQNNTSLALLWQIKRLEGIFLDRWLSDWGADDGGLEWGSGAVVGAVPGAAWA